jgi:malonyl-CoA O-methyltransferase
MLIGADEAYALWAPEYGRQPNPVLALEMRVLRDRLGPLHAQTVLDAGCGAGRWMSHLRSRGARVFGLDRSAAMLKHASGSLVRGDINALPFADAGMDLALCSMTLGYLASAENALRELLRVARRVIVTDFHPAALKAGFTRSFRIAGQLYEIQNYPHFPGCFDTGPATLEWIAEACFAAPERPLFEAAGKGDAFEAACRTPVIYAACWSGLTL